MTWHDLSPQELAPVSHMIDWQTRVIQLPPVWLPTYIMVEQVTR